MWLEIDLETEGEDARIGGRGGGGLPGTGRAAPIIEDPAQLTPQLDAFESGVGG